MGTVTRRLSALLAIFGHATEYGHGRNLKGQLGEPTTSAKPSPPEPCIGSGTSLAGSCERKYAKVRESRRGRDRLVIAVSEIHHERCRRRQVRPPGWLSGSEPIPNRSCCQGRPLLKFESRFRKCPCALETHPACS